MFCAHRYEEAVDLALGFEDVELAREVADAVNADEFGLGAVGRQASQGEELKRMLWLRIARFVIEKENDVNKAMRFLQVAFFCENTNFGEFLTLASALSLC